MVSGVYLCNCNAISITKLELYSWGLLVAFRLMANWIISILMENNLLQIGCCILSIKIPSNGDA
jgi:hypothetical protein